MMKKQAKILCSMLLAALLTLSVFPSTSSASKPTSTNTAWVLRSLYHSALTAIVCRCAVEK